MVRNEGVNLFKYSTRKDDSVRLRLFTFMDVLIDTLKGIHNILSLV